MNSCKGGEEEGGGRILEVQRKGREAAVIIMRDGGLVRGRGCREVRGR